MLHCTFVQTSSLDKERNNHWDFNFQPPESFSDAEGNLSLDTAAAVLPFVLPATEESVSGAHVKESDLRIVRYSIQQCM